MAKLLDLLAVDPAARDFGFMGQGHRLAAGTPLPAPAVIFPRYIEPDATA